ncbi:MAG: LPS export ABC transporter periplasmic protein LptC [Candidatus Cloacimonetes bacterium]|nr:LPS export ABC transporter periplasmic protein LptC [Candidatus Cloacimonadota bacterium]
MKITTTSTIIIIFLLSGISCQNREPETTSDNQIKRCLEITDSIIVYNSFRDKIEWLLYADVLKKFTKENILHFKNVKLEMLSSDGIVSSTIYADSAKVDDNNNKIIAKGNIQVYSKEGNLFGNLLVWDRKNDKIYSNDWVKIIKDGNTIWGNQLESDSHFQHVILRKVSAEGEVSESQNVW